MIEIEYCEACGEFDQAEIVENRLLKELELGLEDIKLVSCDRCVFNVRIDGETVHSQQSHLHDAETVVESVREHMVSGD